jgi:lysophospholipase L1-like esterase
LQPLEAARLILPKEQHMKFMTQRTLVGWLAATALVCAALSASTVSSFFGTANGFGKQHWVATWANAVTARPQSAQPSQLPASPLNFNNQTLRQIIRVSVGGNQIRVLLANTFGTVPLAVGSAHVSIRQKDAVIVTKSDRQLTFGGNGATTIPAGAVMYSDPVTLTVAPLADLAIDLYLPGDTAASNSPLTTHGGTGGLQTNYVSSAGDHTGAGEFPISTTTLSWFFLARVEVMGPQQVGAIVAIGDSITDGSHSTPDTNSRWPSQFARRLLTQSPAVKMAVLNAGISGNRLLTDGGVGVSTLARLDRDVLMQTGATHVIVLIGINDIGNRPRPKIEDLIVGHRQIIERAHARGLTVYGATLTPFEGTTIPTYWSAEGEATRQALNSWIRTGGAFDGVLDFDAVVRDPGSPTKILPQYDSGDHLHPNDIGYGALANAIDLGLFQGATRQ